LAFRHLRVGWWGLTVFLTVGLLLEALHGFKVGFYTQPANHWRREMWTLAHAHGGLISMVSLMFAQALGRPALGPAPVKLISNLLTSALVLMPLGFWLGGLAPSETDPGVGVLLVPAGGLALVAGVLLAAANLSPPDGEA